MSDTIGRITVPFVTPSGTFPLKTRWPYGKRLQRPVVVHTFGSASAKIEQRFFVGSPAERYTFQHPQLSRSDRSALRDFWESSQGCAGAFTYAVPQEDGTTVNTTCCFENQPLTFQELTDTITSVGVTLVAIPDPASAPTYALNSTVTRFPDATLNPALLQQVQEIIPLVRIRVLDSAVPDMFLSDRRVTIGSQLYLPRLLRIGEPGNEPLITQSIDGSSDDVTFAFGNADRVMVQVANDTQLRWARIELSLFHVATGYKLNLWAGYVIDWHSDAGPEFTLRASDILSALTLSSPTGNISRTCWRRYGQDGCPAVPGSQAMDTTHFPSSDNTKCDFGYNTPNGCMAHQVQQSFGGCYATPQGVTIWNNNAASGGGLLRATSLISDTVFGATLPEIWHDDEGVTQWGLPAACKIVAGRDESDYYAALGIIGKGPLGALTPPGMWDSDGDGKKDTFIGSTLDGQPNHGYQVDAMGNLKPGANATFGYRYGLGSDPAGSHDYFSLSRVNFLPRGWYTNPTDGSPMEEIAYNSSAYNLVYAAGNAFLEIRRTDQAGVQPSLPDSHQLVARISKGLTAYTWTAPGSRGTAAGSTNPFWVAINTYLRAINQLTAAAATQETYFDVAAAVAAAAIADTSVAKLFGTGTEKQFQFKGSIDQRYPTRDWLRLILANAAGYFTWSWGALKVGCRYNASSLSSFTSGNMLFNSLVIQPIKPTFEKLTMGFLDQEYLFASNTVDYLDQDYAARNGRLTNPFAQTINLTGTSSKSQAGRLAVIRAREELGGAVQSEQDAARLAMFRTTILALETEPGMVVSIADADIPGGTGNFRIQSFRVNRDWSIDIQAKSVTASMYDVTTGPKPTDVAAAPVPVDPLRDTGVADAPTFAVEVSPLDPTVAEIAGLAFDDAANTHTVSSGTFNFWYSDPTSPLTTLASNMGLAATSITLTSGTVSAGDYLQIGRNIMLCGTPSGSTVPVTVAQLGSMDDTASSGDNVFKLSLRVATAAVPLDFTNSTDAASWKLLQPLPNMRLASVVGTVRNIYGDSAATTINLTDNADHGMLLTVPAAGSTADTVVAITNTATTTLSAVQQIVEVIATTTDCTLNLPTDASMAGHTIRVVLANGSTHNAVLHPAGADMINGASGNYTISTGGASVTIEATGAGNWLIVGSAGSVTATAAPDAPNVTIASATAFYEGYGNLTVFGFQFTLDLPTTDPNYSHLKQIYAVGTGPDGRSVPICSQIPSSFFTGSTLTIKGDTFPQPNTSGTWTLKFYAINDDGVAAASPATTTVPVNGAAVASITASEVTAAGGTYKSPDGALCKTIQFTPALVGNQVPQTINIWANKQGADAIYRGLWRVDSVGQTLYIGAQGAWDQYGVISPTLADETWVVTACSGIVGSTATPPAYAVSSDPFTMHAPTAPSATAATNAWIDSLVVMQASGAWGWKNLFTTLPLDDPNFKGARWTVQNGHYTSPGNPATFVSGGATAQHAGAEVPFTDYDGVHVYRLPGSNIVSYQNNNPSDMWTIPDAVLPDGTANPDNIFRLRNLIASPLAQSATNDATWTYQNDWSGGVGVSAAGTNAYLDIVFDLSKGKKTAANLDTGTKAPGQVIPLGNGLQLDGSSNVITKLAGGLTFDGSGNNVANLGYTMYINGSGQIALQNLPAVFGLPTLPSAAYPQGSVILNTADSKVYRNTTGAAWVKSSDPADLVAGAVATGVTIAASQISAGTLAAGVVYAGVVAASQVQAGTFTGFHFVGSDLVLNLNGVTTTIANTSVGVLGGYAGLKCLDNTHNNYAVVIPTGFALISGTGNYGAYLTCGNDGHDADLLVYGSGDPYTFEFNTLAGLTVNGSSAKTTTISYTKPGGATGTLTFTQGILTAFS